MYAYIRGTAAEVLPDRAVLEAAGVGYELLCSSQTLKRLAAGREAKLYTHLYLADGVMALYGFFDTAVLSQLSPQDVAIAIVTENAAAFDRVPGMGRKTAQRLLLELKERVQTEEMLGGGEAPAAQTQDLRAEAVAALVSLGYDGLSASRAVTAVEDAASVEELIKKALRAFAK